MCARITGATLIGSAEVGRYVHDALRTTPFQRIPLACWLDSIEHAPLARGDLETLRWLPRLEFLDTAWWQRCSGRGRTRLANLTRRTLDLTPGTTLKRYRLSSARWLRSHGLSLAAIAPSVGYSSKQSLSRALHDADSEVAVDPQNC